VEVAFFAEIAFIFNEKPDFPVENVIDLFRLMLVRLGMITRSAGSDHQAALVAIAFADGHRTGPGVAALNPIILGNFVAFDVQGHKHLPP
jgi:hypothetical protein